MSEPYYAGHVLAALRWLKAQGRPCYASELADGIGLTRAQACLVVEAAPYCFNRDRDLVQPSVQGLLRLQGEVRETPEGPWLPKYQGTWPCTGSRRGVYVAAPLADPGGEPPGSRRVLGPLSPGSADLLGELLLAVGGDPGLAARQAQALARAAELARQDVAAAGGGAAELAESLAACTNARLVGGVAAGPCGVTEVDEAGEPPVVVRIVE